MRLVKAAQASPHAKFYSLSTGLRVKDFYARCSSGQTRSQGGARGGAVAPHQKLYFAPQINPVERHF